jgi:hypothetical protein
VLSGGRVAVGLAVGVAGGVGVDVALGVGGIGGAGREPGMRASRRAGAAVLPQGEIAITSISYVLPRTGDRTVIRGDTCT